MLIDSSILVAIVTSEPERLGFLEKIAAASIRKISAASLLETRIVLYRKKGPAAQALLEQFIVEAGIEIVDLTKNQATLAFDAYVRFGKGMGHPAQLNILDCCTYALAADSSEPILFKGADFDKTDIAVVK